MKFVVRLRIYKQRNTIGKQRSHPSSILLKSSSPCCEDFNDNTVVICNHIKDIWYVVCFKVDASKEQFLDRLVVRKPKKRQLGCHLVLRTTTYKRRLKCQKCILFVSTLFQHGYKKPVDFSGASETPKYSSDLAITRLEEDNKLMKKHVWKVSIA